MTKPDRVSSANNEAEMSLLKGFFTLINVVDAIVHFDRIKQSLQIISPIV